MNAFKKPCSSIPHTKVLPETSRSRQILLKSQSRTIQAEPWKKAYERHPLVQSASREERTRILPVGLYMDARQLAKRDSLLVFTAHIQPSRTRHLALAIRKSSMCDCGCRGWCSLFLCTYSSCAALCRWRQVKTIRPDTMCLYGRPKQSIERHRHEAFVMDIQGGWAGFALKWWFPTWSSMHHPCFACNMTLQDKTDGWVGRTMDDYINCCASCEVWTVIPNSW